MFILQEELCAIRDMLERDGAVERLAVKLTAIRKKRVSKINIYIHVHTVNGNCVVEMV